MKNILLPLALLALLAAGGGCKKADPDAGLPDATQTGANTAGCFVNGEPFVASGFGSGPGRVSGIGGGVSFDSAFYLRLNGRFGNQEGTIHLFLSSFQFGKGRTITGRYPLNKDTQYLPAIDPSTAQNYGVFFPNDYSQDALGTTALSTGYVDVTKVDEGNRIVSGTFEFTGVSYQDPQRTIRITGGRFDRKQ